MSVNDIIDGVIRREGGFVDREADRGSATNYGITIDTLAAWRGRLVSVDEVRALTENEARDIYRDLYITKPGFLGIENETVREFLVDCAVNHGPRRAVKLLQLAVREYPDGILGPKTRDGANRMTPAPLYRRIVAARARLYGEIITADPSQAVFAKGWMARLAEFVEASP